MMDSFDYIKQNYERISYNIGEAANGRDVALVAVTKNIPPEAVNFAIACGIRIIGENRVQEYLLKKESYAAADVHFIGKLQTNKVRRIIPDVSLVQSVDSFSLATEINKQSIKYNIIQDVLIEVNIGGEEAKSGVAPCMLTDIIEEISQLSNIRIRGLMAIPPVNSEGAFFGRMNELYTELSEKRLERVKIDILSMGMSADYVAAIKNGATMVRIGTALFGDRNRT